MRFAIACATLLLITGCSQVQSANPFQNGQRYMDPDREQADTSARPMQQQSAAEGGMTPQEEAKKAAEFEKGIIKAFPDIPIPASHRVDLERTVIFTSPSQTVGKISLDGPGKVEKLFRFFEEQMTTQGWSLVNSFQSSTSSLYFAKPGRFVAIIIEALGSNSRITINIGPE